MSTVLLYDAMSGEEWVWDPMYASHPVYYPDYVIADAWPKLDFARLNVALTLIGKDHVARSRMEYRGGRSH